MCRSPVLRNTYLAEIDTLRALAVTLVLLFHAIPTLVPSGFLGVDIFFVISGFVIARTYLFDLLDQGCRLADFLTARCRRLFPSLAITILGTGIFAFFILKPRQLLEFGQSILPQPFYLQNLYYWEIGDYFAQPTDKPLLHTWSLAVEEQFYLSFSILCLIGRLNRRMFWFIFIIFTFTSFIIYMLFWTTSISPRSAFYLLPGRFWQVALGMAAYIAVRRYGHRITSTGCSTTIAIYIAVFSAPLILIGTPVGTELGLLIACVTTATALFLVDSRPSPSFLLKFPPLLFIGRISYSLYLWHWPVISLATLAIGRNLFPSEGAYAILAAVGLAYMTVIFVENPIRRRKILPTRDGLIRACLLGSVAVLTIAFGFIISDGAMFRYPKKIQTLFAATEDKIEYRCSIYDRLLFFIMPTCPVNSVAKGPGLLVLGDSHADQLIRVLGALGDDYGLRVIYASRTPCMIGQFGPGGYCRADDLRAIIEDARRQDVQDVLSISIWSPSGIGDEQFEKDTGRIIQSGMKLWIMEHVPIDAGFDPAARADKALRGGEITDAGISKATYLQQISASRVFFERLKREFPRSIQVLTPQVVLCPTDECDFQTDGHPNYSDSNHLTQIGAARLTPILKPVFQSISTSR